MPAFKEYKEAKSQLPLFKISVNSNQPLSVQLNEYDKKKSALKYSASDRVVSSSKLLLNYDFLERIEGFKVRAIDEISKKETIKSQDYEKRNLSKSYRLSAKQNFEIIKISNTLSQGKSVSVNLITGVLEDS